MGLWASRTDWHGEVARYFSRGERRKYAGKKVTLNHQVMSPKRSPLSHLDVSEAGGRANEGVGYRSIVSDYATEI